MPDNASRKNAVALAACVALLGGALSWWCVQPPKLGIDDADITLVYARNISTGGGYVYNTGGERVEGSTSLLWVLMTSAVVRLPGAEWIIAIMALCLTVWALAYAFRTAALLTSTYAAARDREACGPLLVMAGWLLCLPGFFSWTLLTLMDLAVWTLVVQALVYESAKAVATPSASASTALVFWSAVAVICRPEGLVLVPAALVFQVLCRAGHGSLVRAVRTVQPALIAFLGMLVVVTLGRWLYFGYPFPNTYYAKVGPDRIDTILSGLGYLKWYLSWRPWVTVTISASAFATLWIVLRALRERQPLEAVDRTVVIVGSMAALGLVLPIPNGGDPFASFRFFQPFAPLFCLPILAVASRHIEYWKRCRPALAVAVAVVALGAWVQHRTSHGLIQEFTISADGRAAGHILNQVLPEPRPRVAVVTAGGIAIEYDGPVADLMGLNWVDMAHAKHAPGGFRGHLGFNADVFWRALPEVVLLDQLPRTTPPKNAAPVGRAPCGIHWVGPA